MRYMIVDKEKGLFLGTLNDYHMFAKGNIFTVIKAPSFDTEEKAMTYIAYISKLGGFDLGVISLDTNQKYVNITEVIKQGYGDYTHDLINFLPMLSEEIH